MIKNSGERVSFISSILLLIALGHSRYYAVKYPFQQRLLTHSSKKRRKFFLGYLLSILFVTIIFTLPVTLEIENESNETFSQTSQVRTRFLNLNETIRAGRKSKLF